MELDQGFLHLLTQFREDAAQVFHDGFHLDHGARGEHGGLGKVGAGFGAVILEPGDVEAVIRFDELLAGARP